MTALDPFTSQTPSDLAPPFGERFYLAGAQEVARALLGAVLVRHGERRQVGRIVETEAYVGESDLACHARFGRTGRTEVMYGPPGRGYVYLIYGMYDMLNVVCAPEGEPHAVLIRSVEPLSGISGRTDGPGRLTRAMDIGRSLNGLPLWLPPLTIHPFEAIEDPVITPRIGIGYAGEWRDAPLRFLAPKADKAASRS